MMGPPLQHLKPLESLYDSSYPQKTVIVTTMWRSVEEAEGLQHEGRLREHWKSTLDLESNMVRYEDTAESAWGAVNLVLLLTNMAPQSQDLSVNTKSELPRSQELLEEALIIA
jgi:hypothetical protein